MVVCSPAMAGTGRRAGYLKERDPGVWRISAEGKPNPITGKRKRLWRTVRGGRRDAERALAALITELADGTTVAGSDTFGGLLDEWWTTMAGSRWEDATAIRHRQDIDGVLAQLGRRRLGDLRPADFTRLYSAMTGAGRAPRTVQHVANTARAALNWGVEQGLLGRNPAAAAVVPRRKHVVRALPTAEQLDAVLDAAAADSRLWHAFLTVEFGTGARPAEVCALRWSDFDPDRAELRIGEAVGRLRDERGKSVGWQLKGTKTHSETESGVRTVALDLATSTVLRRWRMHQVALCLQVGEALADDMHIFPADRFGWRPLTPATPSRRWRRYAAPAGVGPEVKLYDAARHYHTSWLLEQGFPVADVAERTGNTPETIYKRYAHTLQKDQRHMAAAIDRANAARGRRA